MVKASCSNSFSLAIIWMLTWDGMSVLLPTYQLTMLNCTLHFSQMSMHSLKHLVSNKWPSRPTTMNELALRSPFGLFLLFSFYTATIAACSLTARSLAM